MQENEQKGAEADDDGKNDYRGALVIFPNRYDPNDTSDNACRECNGDRHIPPVIFKMKYVQYQNKHARSGNGE